MMTFALIFSAVLFLIGLLVFTARMGKMLPAGVKLIPFIAIALLWIHTYFFVLANKTGIIDVIIIIVFYFIVITIILPLGLGIIVFSILDRERVIPPEIIGDPSRKDKICIVYHPGISGATIAAIRVFALKLFEKGYSITVASAHRKLAVIFKNYKAIGFASPIYAGAIRPPIERFVKRNNFKGMTCFLLLTGTVKKEAAADIQKASKIVESSNGTVTASIKVVVTDPEPERTKEMAAFALTVLSRL
jgi:hypothetical protein